MGNLLVVESYETAGIVVYLFCVGFEVLGGIFRKLEPASLKGLLLFACKSLRDSEDDEARFVGADFSGRACAVAPFGQVDNTIENASTRAARILDQAFISDLFCGSMNSAK